jgi:hypothetical protein
LHNGEEVIYRGIYDEASENLEIFKTKSENSGSGDVENCLNALYGLLLLRLRKKPVSKETEIAMASFSKVLAFLSKRFLEVERGEREI